jgi:transcriptional regulator with XRE-family HTH domain
VDKNDSIQPIHANIANFLRSWRCTLRESQTEFWRRFGVTQSTGSRFEKGMQLPASVAILVWLYLENRISDRDLHSAQENFSGKIASDQQAHTQLGREN